MLPNASGFGPPSSCPPASFAVDSVILDSGCLALDGGSLAIGLLGFLVGSETKRRSAVIDCNPGVEFTAKLGCVEAAGRVAALTKPSVGWMLLTLKTPVTSLPGLDAEGSGA
jgi:hypothetical protein